MTKKILSIILIATLLGSSAELGATGDKDTISPPPKIIGRLVSLNVDFDIFRYQFREPYLYFISPAPKKSFAFTNPHFTYLGRMPRETILEIVDVGKVEFRIKKFYWVKPLSPINEIIKDNLSHEVHPSLENLDYQVFEIRRTWRDSGLFGDSDEVPTLDKKWFTIIDTND